MVKERHVEAKLLSLARFSKVVMILGARQVGKSTLLKKVFPHIPHITFDAHQDLLTLKEILTFFWPSSQALLFSMRFNTFLNFYPPLNAKSTSRISQANTF